MPSGLGPYEGRRSAMRDDASWAAAIMWARGVGKQLTGGRPCCLEPPAIGCDDLLSLAFGVAVMLVPLATAGQMIGKRG
ncbi:hypothetical protein PQQ96_40800 [Paraburkholderia sediminicola]|uniref:hypothetical protein n=1 Tax=Paraburkholderia sediminicola TaxID=458836 RepID=UPI0038B8D41B